MEWKTRAHDRPVDLTDRLRAAGFLPEPRETVLVGLVDGLSGQHVPLPPEVSVRSTVAPADMRRIAAMESEVWQADLAAERGVRYLQVDASDDSRPILQRLGFAAVTTTTPYVWAP
ncbi:MAG: hypothetical protein ACRDPY_49715 [Streptosporangiaceae bacterium]